jgi:hypothetical protein
MRRLLAVLLLPLLLLAACGDDGADQTVTDDDPTSDVPDPGDPTDPGATEPPAGTDPVTPTPGLLDPRPTAIDSVAVAAGGDGDKLEVSFYNGVRECYGLDRVEVDESDDSVTIGVFTGSLPPGDQVCIEIAELQVTVVALDAPLGDRVVVDASTGAAVPVG